ncbi:MAG TPA: DUF4153 domain-containing protein [Lutibacter sp.]|nr:DUF4153 domain-containing protein [Lutibacter sp.]
MNLLASFNEMLHKAKKAVLGFPITLLWASVGTFFTIWFVDQKIERDLEYIFIKIILTAILGVSWLIATRLVINYFNKERGKNIFWLIGIPLLFLGIYYLSLPNDTIAFDDYTVPYRFVLFLITGHLVLFFSPFIFVWDKNAYWSYLKSVFASFAKSALFSLVIYFGLSLALLALKYLFKFDFKDKIFAELFIFCLGIINTWLFVGDLPMNIHQNKTIDYPKSLLVLVKYILIPLSILYLVILYAYSFKIIINWNLPKGWVSYLVVALSILGFLIHILINPIQKNSKSRIIKRFYPWFYYALLPLIILLFIAIYKRISEYGITENRYLVLLLAFWILGMTLYVLFSKRKQLRYFPMSVAILAMLVSFGFWSVFSVSKNSQANQFKEVYTKMKAVNFEVKASEEQSFESIIHYLSKRNALDKISEVLGFKPSQVFKETNQYLIARKISDTLGIKVVDFDNMSKRLHENIRRYYSQDNQDFIDVKGYDYLKQMYLSSENIPRVIPKIQFKNKEHLYSIVLDTVLKSAVYITKEKDTIQRVDLTDFLNSLDTFQGYDKEVSPEKLSFEKEFKHLKIKILFNNLSIKDYKEGKKIPIEINHSSGTILLKEKTSN